MYFANSELSSIFMIQVLRKYKLDICRYKNINYVTIRRTYSSTYKNLISPGQIQAISAYRNNIHINISQSTSFMIELQKSTDIKMKIYIYNQTCILISKQSSSILQKDIKLNNQINLMLINMYIFIQEEHQFDKLYCLQLIKSDSKDIKIIFTLFNEQARINRFILESTNIQKTCFIDNNIVPKDRNIQVTATNNYPLIKPQKATIALYLYNSSKGQYIYRQLKVASADFLINGNIYSVLTIIDKQLIENIKNDYNYILKIPKSNGEFGDTMYPQFEFLVKL
ncbi:hypothetical protein SS50377_21368 [Spironucleus salmonicida]|uniref:Uncharacterized protein n=1 Tax=Spironucleus salmonicida TaxID=348837 RepID=A0A9P8S0E8_9EUKA|nr:hypothetical protein SS50377_21368 [Spironucleus salmonicida]